MIFNELFAGWIDSIIREEKPDKKIIAYGFGIFETPSCSSGFAVYLFGAETYDPDDDDWAAGSGDYTPNDELMYLYLPEPEFKNLKWDKVQELVEKEVKKFIASEKFKSSFFERADAIVVGFDDGELVRLK